MIRDRLATAVRQRLAPTLPALANYSYHVHTTRRDATSSTCPSCHVESAARQLTACERAVWVIACPRCETVSIVVKEQGA